MIQGDIEGDTSPSYDNKWGVVFELLFNEWELRWIEQRQRDSIVITSLKSYYDNIMSSYPTPKKIK